MSLVRTGDLLDDAVTARSAVVAFNVITLEHAEGIVRGAQDAGRPVVLAVSENAVRFHGSLAPLAAAVGALALESGVPVALHLDHVESPDLLERTAAAGFSSVMFDAGALPHEENTARTAAAVRWARDHGVWIEAELGYVGGKPDSPAGAHAPGVRTDLREAQDFVAATGVDALAVAVGSSHAMTSRTAVLDHALIAELAGGLAVPLVLHGSSGVAPPELRAAVAAGMRKINVGTALNVAYTGAVRARLDADATVVDPRRYLTPARDAVAAAVRDLLTDVLDRS